MLHFLVKILKSLTKFINSVKTLLPQTSGAGCLAFLVKLWIREEATAAKKDCIQLPGSINMVKVEYSTAHLDTEMKFTGTLMFSNTI